MSVNAFTFLQHEAIEHGLNEAIILFQIRNFVLWAKRNNQHCFEGRHWTHNTRKAWSEHFGFMSEKQARDAIENLVKKGILIKGDFAENRFRRPTFLSLNDDSALALQGQSSGPTGPDVIAPEGHSTLAPQGHSSINNYISTRDHINIAQSETRPSEFEEVYKKYPRKEGKSRGLKIYKAQIKTSEDVQDLIRAIQNYTAHVRARATDVKFIKHFSSFMAEWRDWIIVEQSNVEKLMPSQEELEKLYGVKK